jgi:5-formyltetrahydrofolate cyclo-ligase
MTDKRSLRAAVRLARDRFAATPHLPIHVDPAFEALLRPRLVVASYVPIGSEADPAPLERAAVAHGCVLALPHVVDRATPLRFLRWDPAIALADGPFGLRQPAAYLDDVVPDIVLTPLVAFDRALNRIGQGAGHYDRAFAAFPHARRIGIAWSVQQIDTIPADPWDAPLHAIATERAWLAA